MPREDVEVMRESLEHWLRGDMDAWLETIHPDVGWDISAHPLPDVPNRGRGREALVSEMLATYLSGWNDYSVEAREFVDAGGGDVVVVLHETATMGGSGVALDRDLVQLWTVHDGRAVFLRVFQSRAEALEAAGG